MTQQIEEDDIDFRILPENDMDFHIHIVQNRKDFLIDLVDFETKEIDLGM